ncbi:hypothetical protein QBZ16_000448 [Prototheca wickerhamii]|uniref:Uncharacterized protein n=1 Tax=Prototheca wickerhamii TaxID=3111 RepID=A0AAD9MIR4_PROWI|nr:hypothetical protein QBZ16_000448 [Prototheca wickerhamii]
MWFAAPEVNESDAILADQLRTYERQIEDCELATPISHWDGFSGLVRVSDEPLALLLQKRTRQPENEHAATEQEAIPAASPFAAATVQRRGEDGAPPSGTDPLHSMLESARSLLARGKRQEAGTVLQAVLASAPFKRVDVSREAIAMLLEARGYADERPPRAPAVCPPDKGEPRRALFILQKARQMLGNEAEGREAEQISLLSDYIEARHHI